MSTATGLSHGSRLSSIEVLSSSPVATSPLAFDAPGADSARPKIAVVVPCYRVRGKILTVVESLRGLADYVIAVDDKCPEESGTHLRAHAAHPGLRIIFHPENRGVGGAMITGCAAALETDAEIFVKMDGDGQMDAGHLRSLIQPLVARRADFAKGNRFFNLLALRAMPRTRRIGNFGLTLLAKAASGFWHISDPTNGFFAVRRGALRLVNFHLLDTRYFFEISLLVQLNVMRAVAVDVPMPAKYADENSSLNPWRALWSFPGKLLGSFFHRICWRYFIYDVNMVSVFLAVGLALFLGGGIFGAWRWSTDIWDRTDESAGTVALAMLPIILGFQMLLQAMVLDVVDKPSEPISDVLGGE